MGAVRKHVDERLQDSVALDEIDLYSDVLSAVAATDRPLTAAELDAALGVSRGSGSASGGGKGSGSKRRRG